MVGRVMEFRSISAPIAFCSLKEVCAIPQLLGTGPMGLEG